MHLFVRMTSESDKVFTRVVAINQCSVKNCVYSVGYRSPTPTWVMCNQLLRYFVKNSCKQPSKQRNVLTSVQSCFETCSINQEQYNFEDLTHSMLQLVYLEGPGRRAKPIALVDGLRPLPWSSWKDYVLACNLSSLNASFLFSKLIKNILFYIIGISIACTENCLVQ